MGATVVALEHRAAPEPFPRGRERGRRVPAEASLVEPYGGRRGGELRPALRRHLLHRARGAAQMGLGQLLLAEGEHRGPEGQRQLGAGIDALARHGLENRPQRSHLAVDHEVDPVVDDELRAQIPHAPDGHVTQRRRAIAVRGEPHRGTPVQLLELAAELRAQLRAQQLREERVIAVPRAVLVERQPAARRHARGGRASADRPSRRSAHRPAHRRPCRRSDVRSRNSRRSGGCRASTSLSR